MYFKTYEGFKNFVECNTFYDEELIIFVADKSSSYVDGLIGYLNSKSIRFMGGIFPSLLVGAQNKAEGIVVQRAKPVLTTMVLPFMMRCNLDVSMLENATAVVIADGLSSKIRELTDTLYGKLGSGVKYIGGGAGFANMDHKPCVFDSKGLYKDVLMVSIIEAETILGVKHGWKRLSGPFYVTESNENILSEIDSENAFEVYRHVIEENEDIVLCKEDFFTYAKDHPFGISQEGDSDIVRDPIKLSDMKEIVCVADIPKESDIYILKGDADTLLESSIEVSQECAYNNPHEKYRVLLFNCISRSMFLEERFEEELYNIQKRMEPIVFGALSIGEIASTNSGNLVIHNKSIVLGLMAEI